MALALPMASRRCARARRRDAGAGAGTLGWPHRVTSYDRQVPSRDRLRYHSLCDTILYAACGADFHVHRAVVMRKADYFEALYSSEWGDANGAVTLSEIPGGMLISMQPASMLSP
eukprot:6081084-Prymnesium_polylepis.2